MDAAGWSDALLGVCLAEKESDGCDRPRRGRDDQARPVQRDAIGGNAENQRLDQKENSDETGYGGGRQPRASTQLVGQLLRDFGPRQTNLLLEEIGDVADHLRERSRQRRVLQML